MVKTKEPFSVSVAPPKELDPNSEQIFIQDERKWQLNFGALHTQMSADFEYMQQQHGVGGVKKLEQKQGRVTNANEEIRKILIENAGDLLLCPELQAATASVAMYDALQGMLGLVAQTSKTKSLALSDPSDVKKVLPMLNLQYELRTDRPIPENSANVRLEGETETAKQLRLAAIKLTEYTKKS